jgi:hypothetical protein
VKTPSGGSSPTALKANIEFILSDRLEAHPPRERKSHHHGPPTFAVIGLVPIPFVAHGRRRPVDDRSPGLAVQPPVPSRFLLNLVVLGRKDIRMIWLVGSPTSLPTSRFTEATPNLDVFTRPPDAVGVANARHDPASTSMSRGQSRHRHEADYTIEQLCRCGGSFGLCRVRLAWECDLRRLTCPVVIASGAEFEGPFSRTDGVAPNSRPDRLFAEIAAEAPLPKAQREDFRITRLQCDSADESHR